MSTASFLYDVAVNGGPTGLAFVWIYVRQKRMVRALLKIAGKVEGVDEESIEEDIRIV